MMTELSECELLRLKNMREREALVSTELYTTYGILNVFRNAVPLILDSALYPLKMSIRLWADV
jgi:hypothetical protein